MKIDIVTSIPLQGYKLFAEKNYKKFLQHWPKDVKLHLFSEDKLSIKETGINYYDLYKLSPECKNFVINNKNRKWEPPYRQKLYKQLFIKFCFKVYAICLASRIIDTDILVWLDSDINTVADLPADLITKNINAGTVLCYLNRDRSLRNTNKSKSVSAETGLILFNMRNPTTKDFFSRYQELYDSNKIFDMDEVHDAFVFDRLIEQMESEGKGEFKKLTNGTHDFPLPKTEFGKYLVHDMGNKKWKL